MKQQLKSFLLTATVAVAFAVGLAGCSSGVKLDAPVEDKTGTSTMGSGSGSGSGVNNGQGNSAGDGN